MLIPTNHVTACSGLQNTVTPRFTPEANFFAMLQDEGAVLRADDAARADEIVLCFSQQTTKMENWLLVICSSIRAEETFVVPRAWETGARGSEWQRAFRCS